MSIKKFLIIIIGILFSGCNNSSESNSTNKELQKSNNGKEKIEIINNSLENGDLIFQTSRSGQSLAIQLATNSKYSHIGMIYQEDNELFVYEAVQPVKITKLEDWVSRGENGKYVVKRLKNSERYLTDQGIEKMKLVGKQYLGKDYDLQFKWSNDKIYCSELVWKIYKESFNIEIGKLERIGDFDLSDEIVQRKIKERYGDNIPMDELVITPNRMYNAENLITIQEN